MIHDVIGIRNAVQRMAKAEGLTIKEKEGCTQPRTDMVSKVVEVEPLNPYWDQGRMRKWRGEVAHEIGHHSDLCADSLAMMKERNLRFDSVLGGVINGIEDVRNEKHNLGVYLGRDDDLSWTQAYYCRRGVLSLEEATLPLKPESQFKVDLLGWIYKSRARWQRDLAIPAEDFSKFLITDYSEFTPELDALTDAESVYQLAIKLIDASPELDLEQELAAAGKPEGEGEEADGEGDGEGEGEGEGEADDGSAGDTEGTVSFKDLMGHTHSEGGSKSEAYCTIEYDHERDVYTPHKIMTVIKARRMAEDRGTLHERTLIAATVAQGSSLAGQARRLFQARMQTHVVHNQKKGRLDKRDFYRIPTGSVDVFKRKSDAVDPKGTALLVLTDASGSMSGKKFHVASAAAALLNAAVNPLGVPTMIAAFTERHSKGAIHYIVKDFNETRSTDDIITDYSLISDQLIQNADGESIMWAAAQLRARPEARKILLVLSDGMPCCDNEGDIATYTSDAVKYASQFMECYGVGILDKSVEEFYPEFTIIKRIEELNGALLSIIKRKIFS